MPYLTVQEVIERIEQANFLATNKRTTEINRNKEQQGGREFCIPGITRLLTISR